MTFLLLCLIVFLAFLIETAVGFGSTVVTVSLAAQLYPIDLLLPVLLPVNMGVSSYIVLRYGRAIARGVLLRRILPLMGIGLAVGIALFQGSGHGWLKPVFGLFVSTIATVELLGAASRGGAPRPLSRWAGSGWLLAGGVVHGVFATGGPLVVYFAGRELVDKRVFRATLSAVWLVLNSVLLVSYASSGRLSIHTGTMSAGLLVPLGLGMVAGEWLHHRIDPVRFRLLVYAMLLVAGLALVAAAMRAG